MRAIMAESIYFENIRSGKTSNHCRYFKTKDLKSYRSTETESLTKDSLDQKANVFPAKSKRYFNSENYVEVHLAEKSIKQTMIVML